MANLNTKTVEFFIAALLGVTVIICPFTSTIYAAETENSEQNILSSNDSNFPGSENGNYNNYELFFKMMLSVVLVVALGIAALYISKRLLPKITNPTGKRIKVLETAYLGPRKSIHLIEIDSQLILVGSTNERISKLTEITSIKTDFSTTYAEKINNGNNS